MGLESSFGVLVLVFLDYSFHSELVFFKSECLVRCYVLLFASKASKHGVSSFQALTLALSGACWSGKHYWRCCSDWVWWSWRDFLDVVYGPSLERRRLISSLLWLRSTRKNIEISIVGDPHFTWKKGWASGGNAWLFAIATIIATGLLLPGVQSNAIGSAVDLALRSQTVVQLGWWDSGSVDTKLVTAIVVTLFFGFVILGGVKRIVRFVEFSVPFMAFGYMFLSIVIVLKHADQLPSTLSLIFKNALTMKGVTGGALYWGVKRGIYSNEAGQGTAPHAAAASEVQHPAQQGLVQAFSIYVDTIVVCTATALMILITKSYNVVKVVDGRFVPLPGFHNIDSTTNPSTPAFTQLSVSSIFPNFGTIFVAIALCFFALTTLLAYYYYAETNIEYLRRHIKLPGAKTILKLLMMTAVFHGAVRTATVAWGMGDVGVGIMAWLNIVAILILSLMGKPALKSTSRL